MDKTKKIWEKAKQTTSSKREMKDTLEKAGDKLKSLADSSDELQKLKEKIQLLIHMVQSHLTGKYPSFSVSTIILIVFALVYFIIPTDLIPDFIPVLGFTDDASVVFLIVRKLNNDIKTFHEWKEKQSEEVN